MNSKYIWICSIAFAAGIFISLWTLLSPDSENASFPHEPLCEIARQIRYGFTVKNTTDRPVRNASLCVYAPVDKTSTQRVKGVETSHPHDLSVDCLGIGVLHFPLKPIAPYRTRVITIYIVSPYGDASVQIDTWSRVDRISVEQGEAASLPDHHGKRFALPV